MDLPEALKEGEAAPRSRILVWDIPTRLFHWSLVLCFIVAYLTSESERLQLWHVTAGYLFGALLDRAGGGNYM
ncbi:MAG: cytochrome b/b6 domain-containing protein, partial [Rhodocyclales bacterium]|nr:cytochrome b/b6 domain-containing protein [Rhodocyclales bacterium]